MARKLSLILGASVLSGCYVDGGDRTYLTDLESATEIQRQAYMSGAPGSMSAAMVGCVALPEDFSGQISVFGEGTYEDEATGQTEFLVVPPESSEKTGSIELALPIGGYEWTCYVDISRNYTSDTDGVFTYSIIPDRDNLMVFTAFGNSEPPSPGPEAFYYLYSLASHQLIADESDAGHWELISQGLNSDNYLHLATENGLYLLQSKQSASGESAEFYRLDENGVTTLANAPVVDAIFFINNMFVSVSTEYSPEMHTDIRYSADLTVWSDAVSVAGQIRKIHFDTARNVYVAYGYDDESGDALGYVSADLLNWESEELIHPAMNPDDYPLYFFANDAAVAYASTNNFPLIYRASSTASWQAVSDLPEISGGFNVIASAMGEDGQLRLLVTGLDLGSSPAFFIGTSDDGADWTWNQIPLPAEEIYLNNMVLSTDKTVVWNSASESTIIWTEDNGLNWNSVNTDVIEEQLIPYPDDIDIAVQGMMYRDGVYLLSLGSSMYGMMNYLQGMVVATTDFESFNVVSVYRRDSLYAQQADGVYLFVQQDRVNGNTTDIYRYVPQVVETETPAEDNSENEEESPVNQDPVNDPVNNPDVEPAEKVLNGSSKSGGSLFWLSLILLPLAGLRRKSA